MSVRQIAKALGLSKSSAQRRAERGMPTGDVVAARAWIAKFDGAAPTAMPPVSRGTINSLLAASPAGPEQNAAPAPPDGYATERIQREKIRRQREQIALDDLLGKSLNAEDAARVTYTFWRNVRDQMENLGPRVKDQLAAESDPFVVEQLLTGEVRKIFSALSISDALKEPSDDEGPEE